MRNSPGDYYRSQDRVLHARHEVRTSALWGVAEDFGRQAWCNGTQRSWVDQLRFATALNRFNYAAFRQTEQYGVLLHRRCLGA